MDFVEWCDQVLECIITITDSTPIARIVGVDETSIGQSIFPGKFTENEFFGSGYREPILDAVYALKKIGFLSGKQQAWKVNQSGRDHIQKKTSRWMSICARKLEPKQEQFLRAVNTSSHRLGPDYARIRDVEHEILLPNLGWMNGLDGLVLMAGIAQELDQFGLVTYSPAFMMKGQSCATYNGLVWESRRDLTVESMYIDTLVEGWETSSVEFKRELHLDTNDQKLEFIKDVLGLANTKASGQRWLIVGFDDKTHEYSRSPDPTVNQNRIEQIIADYIDPYLDVKYTVADYHLGQVARLEVLRDAQKLPYKVLKDLNGSKKRIIRGQIFVRHGSQVEEPSPDELQGIMEEGNRARSK